MNRRSIEVTRRQMTVALSGAALAACAPAAQQAAGTPVPPRNEPTIALPTNPPTPPPQPTPTPVPWNPLTGRPVGDLGLIRRRIVGVKIDNAPLARPQLGLGQTDVVYEELAEGGLTRFLAFFLEKSPKKVGPVRSSRLTDIYLGQEWDFLFAYAGAGRTTTRLLAEALVPAFKAPELAERIDGTAYTRDNSRPIPHNLFVEIDVIRQEAAKDPILSKEVEIRPFPFTDPPKDVGPLRQINMPYIPDAAVVWRYDEGSSTWKRNMAGQPHVDPIDNQQITAENIVIQYAEIFTAQNVEPDAAGNPVLDAILRGENQLRVFHSGQMFEGKWSKEHDRAKTQYKLADGRPMPFRPGRVWIHIVPMDYKASWA